MLGPVACPLFVRARLEWSGIPREIDHEGRTLFAVALDFDATAVGVDASSHQRQPEPPPVLLA